MVVKEIFKKEYCTLKLHEQTSKGVKHTHTKLFSDMPTKQGK